MSIYAFTSSGLTLQNKVPVITMMKRIYNTMPKQEGAHTETNTISTPESAPYARSTTPHQDYISLSEQKNCKKCGLPFEAHHDLVVTEKGFFHSTCYEDMKTTDEWEKELQDILYPVDIHPSEEKTLKYELEKLIKQAILTARKEERALAKYEAEEKYESALIIMMTRFMKDGEEIEIPKIEIITAKDEWVVFSKENPITTGTQYKLMKNISLTEPGEE